MKKILLHVIPFVGACFLLCGLAGTGLAFENSSNENWHSWHRHHHAPELDPNALGSGLGLLGGVILLLKERNSGR